MNRSRECIALVLTLALGLGLAACEDGGEDEPTPTTAAPSATLPQAATGVIVVELSVESDEEMEGSCWTASQIAARPNAWRCTSDSEIHDPCFSESADDSVVVCPNASAWEMTGVRMNLTEPLPEEEAHQSEDETRAWALELDDGSRCSWISGASGMVGEERVNYDCGDDWFIVGSPQTGEVWTVEKVLLTGVEEPLVPDESAQATVRTVWR